MNTSAPTKTERLNVPGASIYYEVRGSGPLLLVVGQPMTSGPFGPVADLLADRHTVVTYDPHGVGESTVEDRSLPVTDRKSTRLNSSHSKQSRMPSSA